MREYWRHISPINRRSSSQILSVFDLYLFLFPHSILTVFLLHSSTSQQKIDHIWVQPNSYFPWPLFLFHFYPSTFSSQRFSSPSFRNFSSVPDNSLSQETTPITLSRASNHASRPIHSDPDSSFLFFFVLFVSFKKYSHQIKLYIILTSPLRSVDATRTKRDSRFHHVSSLRGFPGVCWHCLKKQIEDSPDAETDSTRKHQPNKTNSKVKRRNNLHITGGETVSYRKNVTRASLEMYNWKSTNDEQTTFNNDVGLYRLPL